MSFLFAFRTCQFVLLHPAAIFSQVVRLEAGMTSAFKASLVSLTTTTLVECPVVGLKLTAPFLDLDRL